MAGVGAADPGTAFGSIISTIVGGLIFVALLGSIIYFLMGGIGWVTAGGDQQQLETARNRIINSIVGLIITGAAWAIVGFIANLFGFTNFPTLSLPILGG